MWSFQKHSWVKMENNISFMDIHTWQNYRSVCQQQTHKSVLLLLLLLFFEFESSREIGSTLHPFWQRWAVHPHSILPEYLTRVPTCWPESMIKISQDTFSAPTGLFSCWNQIRESTEEKACLKSIWTWHLRLETWAFGMRSLPDERLLLPLSIFLSEGNIHT